MISRFISLAVIALFIYITPCYSAPVICADRPDIDFLQSDNNEGKEVIRTGELTVWPKRVTNYLNISGLPTGTLVEITTLSGVLFKKAVAGNVGLLQIYMTDAEAGVFIVKAGEQQVKIYKR